MKHTTGEWIVTQSSKTLRPIVGIRKNSFNVIAAIKGQGSNGQGGFDPEETDANAKLIAAAPDLLEALNNILGKYIDSADPITQLEVNQKLVENAINAIKKATL